MKDEQGRLRRVLMVGGDPVVVERTAAGLVSLNLPSRREAAGPRAEMVAVRDALTEALGEAQR